MSVVEPVILSDAAHCRLRRSLEEREELIVHIIFVPHYYYYYYPRVRTWAMGRALGPGDDTPATAVTIVTI